jgi:hypothetical protein
MIRQEQGIGSYFMERARYRALNRVRVAKREGLPAHDGERYCFRDGSRFGLAVGVRKGVGAGLPIAEGMVRAGMDGAFDLFVSDPFDLAREVTDLERDAERMALGEAVDFGQQMPKGFDVEMDDTLLSSEDGLLEWTAAVNRRLSE